MFCWPCDCYEIQFLFIFLIFLYLSSFETDLSLRAGESTESLSVYEEVNFSISFHFFKEIILINSVSAGTDDAAPDCEVEPQGDGCGAWEPAGSTEGDGKFLYWVLVMRKCIYKIYYMLYNLTVMGGWGGYIVMTLFLFRYWRFFAQPTFLSRQWCGWTSLSSAWCSGNNTFLFWEGFASCQGHK